MPPTWSALPYEGAVRRALVEWKDGGRRDLTPVLGSVLGRTLGQAVQSDERLGRSHVGPVVLVPAPSSGAATRRRGDHPMALLAKTCLTHHHGAPLVVHSALQVRRRVADQARLGQADRAANLAGAIRVQPRLRSTVQGACCVVLDDVVTTGSTLAEAARCLRQEGAQHVVAVTIAATRRRLVQTSGGGLFRPDLGD
jgi:predicted amidophosphoribosyltransferase